MISLPFHGNSWHANCAIHGLAYDQGANSDAVFKYIQCLYENMDSFGGGATENMTAIEIRQAFVDLASNNSILPDVVAQGENSLDIDNLARAAFKYGVQRGIYHTPTFFLARKHLTNVDSTTSLSSLQGIIDGHLKNHNHALE